MTLKLTREVRRRLFDHQGPRIAGEGQCPVKAGDVIDLSSKVSLKVLKVNVRRGGGWSLQYELTDRRDRVRKLKSTPKPQNFDEIRRDRDEHGYPAEPDADEMERASEDSAYTSGFTTLGDAGEAVDRVTQDRLTKDAKTADHLRDQSRRERFERRGIQERLRAAQAEALSRSIDISHHERVIADRVDRIERQLGKDKAA